MPDVQVRISLDSGLWRLIRAAAMLDGITASEWMARLARAELANSLPPTEPSDEDQPQREVADGPDRD